VDVQSQHIMGCLSGEKELALLSIVRVVLVLKILTNYKPADSKRNAAVLPRSYDGRKVNQNEYFAIINMMSPFTWPFLTRLDQIL
jgi:hypothetical protein